VWTPDIRTLFLILFLINAFLTLMLFTYWKTQKTHYGFETWMESLLVISAGYFLFVLRDTIPAFFSVIVGSILIMLSVMMRMESTRRYFWLKPVPLFFYCTLIPFAGLYFYYTYIVDSALLRTLFSTVIIVPCLIVTGILAIRVQDPENRSLRYGFAATLLIVAVFMTARITTWLITPGNYSLLSTDPENTVFFIVTIVTDILSTGFFLMLNMARSQTDLQASEDEHRMLLATMPDFVVVFSGEKILYVNPPLVHRFGISEEEMYRHSLFDYLTPESRAIVAENIQRRNAGGVVPPYEIDIISPSGDLLTLYLQPSYHTITFKGVPATLVVLTDITERKRAEVALQQTNKQLNLLSSITRHDILNQLVALKVYLELSHEVIDNPTILAGYIEKEEQVANTIEHQISFTKDYQELGAAAPAWQNVNASIKKAVAGLPMRDVRVEVDLKNPEIFADRLFEKVFYNLIDNALRYGGADMKTIRVSSQEIDSGLLIVCEDDGVGISAEDKKRLFTRGFGKNTGLGLFLSWEILAITGITIIENGMPGKGAKFEITVPKGMWRMKGENE
jgi:PAS domain S-box-containing protein